MKLISYIQSELGLSRRKITDLIDQKSILLNGKVVESYRQEIQGSDELRVKSYELNFKGIYKIKEFKSDFKIIIFNKPVGYVVSKLDSNNKTIYEILPEEFKNYYYIGRLDKDSHGLLLLTNDPKLVNEYEHPKNQVEKEYVVEVDNILKQSDIKKCLDGIEDDGENLKISKMEKMQGLQRCNYKIILTEGKKRHIRRIFKNLGYRVLDLQRVREGEYKLGNLKVGERKSLDSKI